MGLYILFSAMVVETAGAKLIINAIDVIFFGKGAWTRR